MGLCVVWLRGKKKTFMWGPSIFHLGLDKICLSIMERKLGGESLTVKWQNWPCALLLPFFFLFSFSLWFPGQRCLLIFFFFFFNGFLGNVASSFYIFFSFFWFPGVMLCFFFFFLMVSWATLPPLFLLLFFSFHFLGMVLCVCAFFFF